MLPPPFPSKGAGDALETGRSPVSPQTSDLLRAAALSGHALVLLAHAVAQALLLLYAGHRALVLGRWWRARNRATPAPRPPAEWPVVTVQLPLYNERHVAGRLIDAAAALDYPPGRLEIQVLDDSTDDTRGRAADAVARARARGVDGAHLGRAERTGHKAGALAHGLRRARGGLVAVFDADFLPPPDFLRRLVPHFADPRVGMVQARWGHLNRDRSLLTAAQAAMLDAHFSLEHRTRMAGGLFFNFNGTAGVWRRACIEQAGGWSSETLTEDLDLSYRAQLAGWRFVFEPGVEAPGELPADMEAYKSQQRRWVKGSIQTARRVLPRLLAGPLPAHVKAEAVLHLTNNAVYPLLLVVALLLPVVLPVPAAAARYAWVLHAGSITFGLLPVVLFLAVPRLAAGAPPARAMRDAAGAMVLGMGLSLNNARAVLEGLGRRTGAWERTAKSGDGARRAEGPAYRSAGAGAGLGELALAAYATGIVALAGSAREWATLPFAAALAGGFLGVGIASLRSGRAAARARAPRRTAAKRDGRRRLGRRPSEPHASCVTGA
jgi:hypothetical protein